MDTKINKRKHTKDGFISVLAGVGVLILTFLPVTILFQYLGLFLEDLLLPDCRSVASCPNVFGFSLNVGRLIVVVVGIVVGRVTYKHRKGERVKILQRPAIVYLMEQERNNHKVRDLSIGFFGWWLICGLGYLVSESLGIGLIWDYVFPMVTVVAIGVLFYKRRNWFAYGILVAIIINTLLMVSFWAYFSSTGIKFRFSSWDSPLSFPTLFYLFMGY